MLLVQPPAARVPGRPVGVASGAGCDFLSTRTDGSEVGSFSESPGYRERLLQRAGQGWSGRAGRRKQLSHGVRCRSIDGDRSGVTQPWAGRTDTRQMGPFILCRRVEMVSVLIKSRARAGFIRIERTTSDRWD